MASDRTQNILNPEQRYAFISVYDKTGLIPLAKALVDAYGYELISTGGTYQALKDADIAAIESSTITGFGELLGGRVKSLHPEIFAGILAKRNDPTHETPFRIETVVVNLYPFEAGLREKEAGKAVDLVELIDIGGSALMRAAAKNHQDVNILCSPSQYDGFLQELKLGDGQSSLTFRQNLAYEAFRHSAHYDVLVAGSFTSYATAPEASKETRLQSQITDTSSSLPSHTLSKALSEALTETLTLTLQKQEDLRYGENPHQQAAVYRILTDEPTLNSDYEVLNGKALSYNNLLDMESAWRLVSEFPGQTFAGQVACVIVKHNNPCGVALGVSAERAYHEAFFADSLSAFGGVVAFNTPVTVAVAQQMVDVFLEVIVAPEFEPEALAILQAKKNLRLIRRRLLPTHMENTRLEYRQINEEQFLVQCHQPQWVVDIEDRLQDSQLSLITEKKPTEQQLKDLVFAWKVSKHVKSNAIVLAKDGKTVGIGGGQTSRIGALEQALGHACDDAKDAVMASDGFLPAVDNIHACAQARIAAIIQPGGSIKDEEVTALANQYGLAMLATGIREFKH